MDMGRWSFVFYVRDQWGGSVRKELTVGFSLCWWDLWMGFYFSRQRSVYWCPLPCLVVKFSW